MPTTVGSQLTLHTIASTTRPSLFAYTVNFAANGYPFPYLRGALEERRRAIRTVRDDLVETFRTALRILKPSIGCAFAGPVLFADPESAFLDEDPEALDWSRIVEELDGEVPVVWPAPGSRFLMDGDGVRVISLRPWTQDLLEVSRPTLDDDPVLTAVQPGRDEVMAAAHRLANRIGFVLDRLGKTTETNLVLGIAGDIATLEDEPLYRVVVRPGEVPRMLEAGILPPPPFLDITSLASIIHDFCSAVVDIDALLLSLRARFSRDPDSFDPILHDVLRFGYDPGCLAAMIRDSRSASRLERMHETISVSFEGREITIPRYCPHEGELLAGATIDENQCLVCPRHRWRFDLRTGQCVQGDRSVNLFELTQHETS